MVTDVYWIGYALELWISAGYLLLKLELLLREARYFQISSLVFELEHVLEERRVFVLYTEEKKKKKSQ